MKTYSKHSLLRSFGFAVLLASMSLLLACSSSSSAGGTGPKSPTQGVMSSDGQRVVVKESAIATFSDGVNLMGKNSEQAIARFEQAIKDEKAFPEAYYNIGLLEQERGNYDKANEAYQKALELNPKMGNALTNQAKILIDQGQYEQAEKILLSVVDDKTGIDPFNVAANLNLGMLYRRKGEDILIREAGGVEQSFSMEANKRGEIKNKEAYEIFAKAVVHIRRALAGDSNNIYCYENLSAIYYFMNSLEVGRLVCQQAMLKYSAVNEDLEKSLEAKRITPEEYELKRYKPKDLAAIYNTSGLIYLAEGEVSLANAEFKKAVESDPTSVPAMLNVAGIAVNVQDYQTAYDIYNRVLELDPKNVEAYLSKGVAVRGLNRLEEAEKIYREIIAQNKNYPQAEFNLAVLYQEYYLKIDEARQMWVDFSNNAEAQRLIPGRVEEAKLRIKQIDELKEAQRKAEAQMAEIQRRQQELEAAAAAAAEE